MLVEYLIEINPLVMLLITISTILVLFIITKPKSSPIKKLGTFNEGFISFDKKEKKEKVGETFTVLSYNIMAFNFTRIDWYSYCNPMFLLPKYRSPRIIEEIRNVNADFVCLQEVDTDLYMEYYKTNLENLGYTCIINKATNMKIVTILTAFKADKFKQINNIYIDLNNELDKLDESFIKHKEALITEFKLVKSNNKLVIANTHLFWNPESEYIKYGQVSTIMSHLTTKYKDYPIIFAGDFNSLPKSNVLRYIAKLPPINFFVKGDSHNNKKYMELFYHTKNHELRMRSAYDCYNMEIPSNLLNNEYDNKNQSSDDGLFNKFADEHPKFTNYTKDFNGCLDYIFYSYDKLQVNGLLTTPKDDYIKHYYMPNEVFPSDHIKIAASFSFK